jgi:hypothetical protein
MSTEGARVGSLWRGLSDKLMAMAEEQGMQQDLMCRTTTVQQYDVSVYSNDISDSDTEMVSVEPTNDYLVDNENIDNRYCVAE